MESPEEPGESVLMAHKGLFLLGIEMWGNSANYSGTHLHVFIQMCMKERDGASSV